MSIDSKLLHIVQSAKTASRTLATVSSQEKAEALMTIAEAIEGAVDRIRENNAKDVKAAQDKGLAAALIDRLVLDEKRIAAMCKSLREVALQEDPIGRIEGMWKRPNGLLIGKMVIPLGVIGVIYESRPNVTIDTACLCLKAGNSVVLRGGSEAIHSNSILVDIATEALRDTAIPPGCVGLVRSTSHEVVTQMLKLDEYIDVIIPRGGESLIRTVVENSTIPIIKHYKGVCHTYVDEDADLGMAEEICFNAKVQRPGVCNAMETMLVHNAIAESFLPPMIKRFLSNHVEIRGDVRTCQIVSSTGRAIESDWYTEYLDLILSVKVVSSLKQAIDHINTCGSHHSDAIVTNNYQRARQFLDQVDSATVYVNASTRFTDGAEFGMGAEVGISTDRLHARGPMGINELTTRKFIIFGEGQVRT